MAFDLKGAIASFAPTLATMLGGPLAGTAVAALESAVGLKAGAGADAVTAVVQNSALTPEMVAAIRAADQAHAEKVSQQGLDLVKMNDDFEAQMKSFDVDDRKDARGMQNTTRSSTVPILAYTVVGSFLAMVALTLLGYSHVDGALAGTLVGYLSAKCEQVISFFFGSSASSDRKTELLAKAGPVTTGDS